MTSEENAAFKKGMDNPSSPILPRIEELRQQILEKSAAYLKASQISKIALYGSGPYARPLLRQPWARYGIRVSCVINSENITRSSIGGVPLVSNSPSDLPSDVQAIVIVSPEQSQLYIQQIRERFQSCNAQIIQLYGNHDADYQRDVTIERLTRTTELSSQDVEWLLENRGERHDASLDMLPPARTELHLRRYELAADLCNSNECKTVADLACGTGYGADLLARSSHSQYSGVDIDEQTIEFAQRRHGTDKAKFYCASACETAIDSTSIDLIASFETIEHIEETDQLLKEFVRVLKPNGLLVVSTPNKMGPTPYHVHDFSFESFLLAISDRFEILDVVGQLPLDTIFDQTLPPGMWRIDQSQVDADAIGRENRKPDYLIAIARVRSE